MTKVCSLSIDKAIETIQDEAVVMFKTGVWNSYTPKGVPDAIEQIRKSSYGAEVYVDEDGLLYVQCPSASDMW